METGMCIFSGVSYPEMVEGFKKYGVKRTFIGSEMPDFDNVMKLFLENGIICETLHAPYKKINDMWGEDEIAAKNMIDSLKDAIDKCNKYNIPVVIVHLSSKMPMPEINEIGLKRFEEVFDYADARNVKIALENQRYLENLEFFLNKYDDKGFCWDTGHEFALSVDGDIKNMELFGDKTVALHIHDNRCDFNKDDHLLPYDGAIDFDYVAKAIAKSGYEGTLMLEVTKEADLDGVKLYENLSDDEYIKRAVDALNKLNDSVMTYRKGE